MKISIRINYQDLQENAQEEIRASLLKVLIKDSTIEEDTPDFMRNEIIDHYLNVNDFGNDFEI